MSKLVMFLIGCVGPLVVWVFAFLAISSGILRSRSMLGTLRVTRWSICALGLVLGILYFSLSSSIWLRFGWCVLMFSAGLVIPELWLKARIEESASTSVVPR